MTPADPFPFEVHEPAGCGAVDATSQQKRPRRNRRAARKGFGAADKPHPEEKSALVLWAYVQYQRLCRQGQPPDIEQFCDEFPTCRTALYQMLDFEAFSAAFFERHPPTSADEVIDWPRSDEQRGDFTILRELARGSVARVYLATEASAGGRRVVLKCSVHGDAEARTLGRLVHPHIVPIHSARFDERSGLTLVCMPYLGDTTLEDLLDRLAGAETPPHKASFFHDVLRLRARPEDPPPSPDADLFPGSYADGVLRLAVQLTETLAFLHQSGVWHRDLKPSNVLLDPSGKPLLLDFNLSQSEREAAVFIGGTLRYMAPEQIRALMDHRNDGMDERVDFFALGVMVHEFLGGVHPCDSLLAEPFTPDQLQSMLVDLKAGFRPFREVCPELERPVAAVLDRCVALDPSDRPRSAAELAAELKRQFTPVRRLRRRLVCHRRWLLATLGLLLVAAVVFASVRAFTPPFSAREYQRGRIAYRAGDFATAQMHFDRALHAEPNNDRFRYARGCARLQQSKYLTPDPLLLDDVRDDLTRPQPGATDSRTLAVHAYIDLRKQRYEAAITKYNQVLQQGHRSVMVLNNRAYSYLCKGRVSEAQNDLHAAAKIEPHLPQAVLYNRALLAMRLYLQRKIQRIPPQALQDIEQALQGGAKTSALYRDAAMLYAQAAGNDPRHAHFERALSHLQQALAAGEPAVHFKASPPLMEAIKRPEFVALLGSPPPQASIQPNLQIIDPVDLPD